MPKLLNQSPVFCRDSREQLLRSIKTRRLAITDTELRFAEPQAGEKTYIFEGYPVKWASINTYNERFAKGAFSEMIEKFNAGEKVVHKYYNHGWRNYFDSRASVRIGRWLEFKEDDIGLWAKGELTPGLSLAEDVRAMMKHGTVDGLSIAFYPVPEMDIEELDDHILIKRADLYEISVVDEPSDRQARINRQDEVIKNIVDERDAIDMLHTLGLDETAARNLITKIDSIMDNNQQKPTNDFDPLAFLDD